MSSLNEGINTSVIFLAVSGAKNEYKRYIIPKCPSCSMIGPVTCTYPYI